MVKVAAKRLGLVRPKLLRTSERSVRFGEGWSVDEGTLAPHRPRRRALVGGDGEMDEVRNCGEV